MTHALPGTGGAAVLSIALILWASLRRLNDVLPTLLPPPAAAVPFQPALTGPPRRRSGSDPEPVS